MSILKKQSCWLSKCWNTCTQPWAKNLGYISLSCVTIFFNHWPILRTLWALVAKSGKLTEQYYEVDRDFHTVTFSEGPSAVWAGVVCVCASLRTIVSNALVCLHNPQSDRILFWLYIWPLWLYMCAYTHTNMRVLQILFSEGY